MCLGLYLGLATSCRILFFSVLAPWPHTTINTISCLTTELETHREVTLAEPSVTMSKTKSSSVVSARYLTPGTRTGTNIPNG